MNFFNFNPDGVSLDTLCETFQTLLQEEQNMGPINSLAACQESRARRTRMDHALHSIQEICESLQDKVASLSPLPDANQIQWAQATLAMPTLAFWEIDTTGIQDIDEIIRFTLIDRDGQLIDDFFIRPTTRQLSPSASRANGITPEQLQAGLHPVEAWERMRAALTGRYVISFSQEWDIERLNYMAKQHALPPIWVVGACLQQHATEYYYRRHYSTLEELCARIGSPLPQKPHQTSLDRAQGQRAVLVAFADAVMDVQSLHTETNDDDTYDPFLDEEGL